MLVSVVRPIDVDALNFTSELLFQRFEGEEIVAEDEAVIEKVVVGNAVLGVVGVLRVLQQNPRLQLRPVLLSDPGEFQFSALIAHLSQLTARRDSQELITGDDWWTFESQFRIKSRRHRYRESPAA